jgi:anti-anti-sigma factor
VTQPNSTPSVRPVGCATVIDPPARCGDAAAPNPLEAAIPDLIHVPVPDPVEVTVDGPGTPRSVRVAAAGEIDILTAPRLEAALRAALDAYDLVVVDLSGVTFMDAQGLNALLAAHRDARGTLRVVDASPQSARLLRLTGIDHVLGWT